MFFDVESRHFSKLPISVVAECIPARNVRGSVVDCFLDANRIGSVPNGDSRESR